MQRAPKAGHRKLQRSAVPKVVLQRVERGGPLCHSDHGSNSRSTPSHAVVFCPASIPQCLVTCGKGVRHRQVFCTTGTDEKLSERFCDPSAKPPTAGTCELPECASWTVGVWGEVSPAGREKKTQLCLCVCVYLWCTFKLDLSVPL